MKPMPTMMYEFIKTNGKHMPFMEVINRGANELILTKSKGSIINNSVIVGNSAARSPWEVGQDDPSAAAMVASELFIYACFKKMFGAIIEPTAVLDEMLDNTDIENMPIDIVQLPYQACYFKFNKPIKSSIGGDSNLTGVYIFQRENDEGRTFDISVTCSILDNGADQFGLLKKTVNIDSNSVDKIKTISDLIKTISAIKDSESSQKNQLSQDLIKQAMEKVFKMSFYMGLQEARIVKKLDAANVKLMGSKGGMKKRVDPNLISRKGYGYIDIGPTERSESTYESSCEDRSTSVHWRRGHMRTQHYGKELIVQGYMD